MSDQLPFERIGGETVVLYADLRERLETFEAMRTVAALHGEFTTKIVKGITYHYFQATLPSGRVQLYLGRDNEEIRVLINDQISGRKQALADQKLFQRLGSQIVAGGVAAVPPEMSRIIRRLADSGVFRVGGVLVGTISFIVLGTHLGVKWSATHSMTQDIDLAGDPRIKIAIPDSQADVPAVLDSLRMGFFPVPRLSNKEPSTSYAIRGQTLRIDILTPGTRIDSPPVFIKRLNAAAQPLKYLEYLLEDPIPAVLVNGNPCLVKVPQPAHFALHKLIVSQERGAWSADKNRKDAAQAKAMLSLLREDRPGDIDLARESLAKRGGVWIRKLSRACEKEMIEL